MSEQHQPGEGGTAERKLGGIGSKILFEDAKVRIWNWRSPRRAQRRAPARPRLLPRAGRRRPDRGGARAGQRGRVPRLLRGGRRAGASWCR
ncbi:hypothetical protein ACU686_19120 [Yinghuangia aomiensis]